VSRKPLLIDLSQAAGVNTVPLDITTLDGRRLRFEIPERDDVTRARMVQELGSCKSDEEGRLLAAEWLLACSAGPATRQDVLDIVSVRSTLPQVMTVLLSGRLLPPKQLDQLMARLLDKMMGNLIEAI
jgi:hypothetical protein